MTMITAAISALSTAIIMIVGAMGLAMLAVMGFVWLCCWCAAPRHKGEA